MSVHFLASALDRWDDAGAGALALTFFADERPLRGAAGLADWRLCGRLSRLIKRGKIRGRQGETLLMPPGQRLEFPRVMLFGLGPSARFDEDRFREHVRWIRDVLGRAGVTSYAIQPPGRATGLIAARRALELWLEESDEQQRDDEDVAIIDAPGAQKEMAEILRKAQRRREGTRKGASGSGSAPGSSSSSGSAPSGSGSGSGPAPSGSGSGSGPAPSGSGSGSGSGSALSGSSSGSALSGSVGMHNAAIRRRAATVDDAWD